MFRDWNVSVGNQTRASTVGGEYFRKELFEQRINSYSEHHMRPRQTPDSGSLHFIHKSVSRGCLTLARGTDETFLIILLSRIRISINFSDRQQSFARSLGVSSIVFKVFPENFSFSCSIQIQILIPNQINSNLLVKHELGKVSLLLKLSAKRRKQLINVWFFCPENCCTSCRVTWALWTRWTSTGSSQSSCPSAQTSKSTSGNSSPKDIRQVPAVNDGKVRTQTFLILVAHTQKSTWHRCKWSLREMKSFSAVCACAYCVPFLFLSCYFQINKLRI
jgi:hypothetical protein